MHRTVKILSLVTTAAALGCGGTGGPGASANVAAPAAAEGAIAQAEATEEPTPAAPEDVLEMPEDVLEMMAISHPRTAANGRPACGNVTTRALTVNVRP